MREVLDGESAMDTHPDESTSALNWRSMEDDPEDIPWYKWDGGGEELDEDDDDMEEGHGGGSNEGYMDPRVGSALDLASKMWDPGKGRDSMAKALARPARGRPAGQRGASSAGRIASKLYVRRVVMQGRHRGVSFEIYRKH